MLGSCRKCVHVHSNPGTCVAAQQAPLCVCMYMYVLMVQIMYMYLPFWHSACVHRIGIYIHITVYLST